MTSTQTETETKEERSEQQAKAQLESIRDMLAGLTREGAAGLYVADLDRERCIQLLDEAEGIEDHSDETDDQLRESLADAIIADTVEPDDFDWDEDSARQAIEEDALSVEVRSPWFMVGSPSEDTKPSEFCILLCTGGPACQIRGELDEYMRPHRAWLEHQDWGTPWTQYYEPGIQETLLAYASVFYFGE